MSIKNYSIEDEEEERELNKQFKRLQVELLKLEVKKKEIEVEIKKQDLEMELLHKM